MAWRHGPGGPAVLALSVLVLVLTSAAPARAQPHERHTGTVMFEHRDRGTGLRPHESLVLQTARGAYRVRDRRMRAFIGRRVTVRAQRRGGALVRLRDIVPRARAANHEDWFAEPSGRGGERRVAVVLLSEAGDAARRWDPNETADAMFGTGDSVDAFFRASSEGAVSIAGAVHGWYTVDDLGPGCDMNRISSLAADALRADGVTLGDFHHVMVHFPRRDCGFNGMASIGGAPSLINGRPSDRRLLSHELGHNFGLYHANATSCTREAAAVALSDSCAHHEYGDPFSAMGNGFHRFHAVERARLAWPTWDRSTVADRDGVYELGGPGGSRPEVLSVPRRLGLDWWQAPTHLALELRRPAPPFDAFAADDPAVSGVTIRLAHQVPFQDRWYFAAMPMTLIDATPGSPGGHRDAQLRVGETFVDERRRTAVTLESLQDGVARVRVGWVPSMPSGVTARLAGTDAADVAWSPSEDDEGVERYEVERDGAVVGRTTALQLRDEGLPPGRDLAYRVVAVDRHGNRRPSAPAVVTTPPPTRPSPTTPAAAPSSATADRAAPSLRLRPALGRKGRRVPAGRRLVLTARDARTGTRLEAILDGRRLARRVLRSSRSGRLVIRLPKAALRRRHVLVLRAVDAAGNRTTLRIVIARGVMRRA